MRLAEGGVELPRAAALGRSAREVALDFIIEVHQPDPTHVVIADTAIIGRVVASSRRVYMHARWAIALWTPSRQRRARAAVVQHPAHPLKTRLRRRSCCASTGEQFSRSRRPMTDSAAPSRGSSRSPIDLTLAPTCPLLVCGKLLRGAPRAHQAPMGSSTRHGPPQARIHFGLFRMWVFHNLLGGNPLPPVLEQGGHCVSSHRPGGRAGRRRHSPDGAAHHSKEL